MNFQCNIQQYASIAMPTKPLPFTQGYDELLKMYLHCVSELLSKIHHMMDMSQIPAGLNNYIMGTKFY